MRALRHRKQIAFNLGKTLHKKFKIMGILNVTPDSFSDGGLYTSVDDAMARVDEFISQGVDYIDIGAESTRPGSRPITEDQEWERLEPILSALAKKDLGRTKISLDSKNSSTISKACATGTIQMINDISGTQSSDMLSEFIETAKAKSIELEYCAMHMHETPATMQENPLPTSKAIATCETFFHAAQKKLITAGFKRENIYMDPGVGFGKTDSANLKLLETTPIWSKRFNLLYGISRKSFIGRLLNIASPEDRDAPSKAFELSLAMMGASIIRTHDVRGLARLREVAQAEG